MTNAAYDQLKERLAEIYDLGKAASILSWDQQTKMPRAAGPRAPSSSRRSAGSRTRSSRPPRSGACSTSSKGFEATQPYDSLEASLIRVTRQDWEKARRIPSDLRAEMTRASSLAIPAWAEARQNDDFDAFLPHLKRNVELRHRYIDCFDVVDEPYDVLLDDFERGHDDRRGDVRLRARRRTEQVKLVSELAERSAELGNPLEGKTFPLDGQKQFELEVITTFGYDEDSWRLDPTVHPFASNGSIQDIRITTRYFDDSLDGLLATMHETGHGLYERGHLARPRADAARHAAPRSGSTSRRAAPGRTSSAARCPFWRHFFPRLQATFPDTLVAASTSTSGTGSSTPCEPSLIRVEADEATYNLHIILRFELEQDILSGRVKLEELSEAWNARMQEYLGLEVPERPARRAAGRPLGERGDRLLPDLRARQRRIGADLGEGHGATSPTCTTTSSRATSRSCATG